MDPYEQALERLIRERLPALTRAMVRRFPATPEAVIEEAMQDALLDACSLGRQAWFLQGWQDGGDDELYRRLYTAAWRRVRGEARRVGARRTERLDTGYDVVSLDSPADGAASADELAEWMDARVLTAAGRFGRAREQTLRVALLSLVRAGDAVKPLAERYALPRRYLAEASVWLRRRLEERARGEP